MRSLLLLLMVFANLPSRIEPSDVLSGKEKHIDLRNGSTSFISPALSENSTSATTTISNEKDPASNPRPAVDEMKSTGSSKSHRTVITKRNQPLVHMLLSKQRLSRIHKFQLFVSTDEYRINDSPKSFGAVKDNEAHSREGFLSDGLRARRVKRSSSMNMVSDLGSPSVRSLSKNKRTQMLTLDKLEKDELYHHALAKGLNVMGPDPMLVELPLHPKPVARAFPGLMQSISGKVQKFKEFKSNVQNFQPMQKLQGLSDYTESFQPLSNAAQQNPPVARRAPQDWLRQSEYARKASGTKRETEENYRPQQEYYSPTLYQSLMRYVQPAQSPEKLYEPYGAAAARSDMTSKTVIQPSMLTSNVGSYSHVIRQAPVLTPLANPLPVALVSNVHPAYSNYPYLAQNIFGLQYPSNYIRPGNSFYGSYRIPFYSSEQGIADPGVDYAANKRRMRVVVPQLSPNFQRLAGKQYPSMDVAKRLSWASRSGQRNAGRRSSQKSQKRNSQVNAVERKRKFQKRYPKWGSSSANLEVMPHVAEPREDDVQKLEELIL